MSLAICELLLQPDESRFVMFPVKRTDVWDLYKKSIDCFRKAEDIDLCRDYVDWVKLTDIRNILLKWYSHFLHLVMASSLKI